MQLKQKTLEVQIADLKLQQHQENITAEQTQMQLYSEQVIQLQETEKKLRLQLNADDEKFQQFQVLKNVCIFFLFNFIIFLNIVIIMIIKFIFLSLHLV